MGPNTSSAAVYNVLVDGLPGRCANSPGHGQHLTRRCGHVRRYRFLAHESEGTGLMGGPGSGGKPKAYPAEVVAEVAERYAQGQTQAEIGVAMSLSRHMVYRLMRRYDIARRGVPMERVSDQPVDCSRLATHPPVLRDGNRCWLWQGKVFPTGYGYVERSKSLGVSHYAHRAMYELLVGPIPDGLHIDHLCGVRQCVNPAHLEPVTQAENNRRAADARYR